MNKQSRGFSFSSSSDTYSFSDITHKLTYSHIDYLKNSNLSDAIFLTDHKRLDRNIYQMVIIYNKVKMDLSQTFPYAKYIC